VQRLRNRSPGRLTNLERHDKLEKDGRSEVVVRTAQDDGARTPGVKSMTRPSTDSPAKSDDLTRENVLARAKIVPKLAPSTDGNDIPEGIVGATILGFGTIAWDELYDFGSPNSLGGLVIDYRPSDGSAPRRVSLGFSELGMWVEYSGELEVAKQPRPTLGDDQ
jgi:hypothetical protein